MLLYKNMAILRRVLLLMVGMIVVSNIIGNNGRSCVVDATKAPTRILVDTDLDTDDYFSILYLLKQKRSELDIKAITMSSNAWCNGGHGVNQIYDILHMMDRDDIDVGVGGEGGILPNGTILPNVGGYQPLIDQGMSTVGKCRYKQAVPKGSSGMLGIDTNYGFRRSMLPQGSRRYRPLQQRTAQQVMIDTISKGPTTVLLIGSHTNFAIFLMTNPHLKKNVEHIYVMGGAVRAKNPIGCCSPDNTTCTPTPECGVHGNLFSAYHTNPNAEFNIFLDPFAAYQVMHSGIPMTLVPLDATDTIPIDENFFMEFEKQQTTHEERYCFEGLRINRDIWSNDKFYTSYFMWDSFCAGVLVSTVQTNSKSHKGENEFSEMEYMNITVVTSNKPYGKRDGSNPFFDGRSTPKFNLTKNGVHSGHVQTGINDPFCIVKGKNLGICEDGYTKEVTGSEAVQVLVATQAKPNKDANSTLHKAFFKSFLDSLNNPENSGRFNFTSQFPYYRETFYKPDFRKRKLGKTVIFDMDMSPGDFISLIYLLKVPVEQMYLKGILVNGNGWANAATIDIIYDILHMMGRDDIQVGLGSVNAKGTPEFGCEHVSAIPQGSGGLIDSDTLYGLARDLPRSPRRYTVENSVEHGAPRNTAHPELRQPLALEIWQSVSRAAANSAHDKITILTTGPLTNLVNILHSDDKATSYIEKAYIVGGHISKHRRDRGNIFSVPSNKYAEFNMFLDPLAAKEVFESNLNITLITLKAQRRVASFRSLLKTMQNSQTTPESKFVYGLISLLQKLQKNRKQYHHMDMFIGEVLGAVLMHQQKHLQPSMQEKRLTVLAENEKVKGQIIIDQRIRKSTSVVNSVNSKAYYKAFAKLLNAKLQSAVIASFDEQKKEWSKPHIQ